MSVTRKIKESMYEYETTSGECKFITCRMDAPII